jgi:signal transduction histidine kinase
MTVDLHGFTAGIASPVLVDPEATLAAFLQNAPSLLYTKDLQLRYTLMNRVFIRGLGLRRADVLGNVDAQIFGSEVGARLEAADRRVIATGTSVVTDEDLPGPRGTRCFMLVRFAIKDDQGRTLGLGGIASDTTQRAQRQRMNAILSEVGVRLAESLDVEHTIHVAGAYGGERLADMCWIGLFDKSGLLQPVSTTARRPSDVALMQRLRPSTPLFATRSPIVHTLAATEPRLIGRLTRRFLADIADSDEQRDILLSLRLRSMVLVPLIARGGPIGLLALGTTTRRMTRVDLDGGLELGRRVVLALESAHQYRKVQEAVAARDEAVSIAAHELKTPLAALRLQVERMARRASRGELDDASCASGLSRATGQIDRMASLLDTLFDVARITTGALEIEKTPVDLCQVAREAARDLEPDAIAARCTIVVSAGEACTGRWDRVRLAQVLRNLVANAVKHAPGSTVVVACRQEGGHGIVTVSDDGPGIPEEKIGTIFDPFVKGGGKGLGLGLYIARRIVEAHGGSLSVRSPRGSGATFTLSLPV